MGKLKGVFIVFCSLYFAAGFSQHKTTDSLVVLFSHANNDIQKADLLNAIADQYKGTDPEKMADYATKALVLSQKIKYKIAEGNACLNLGNANVILGNYAKALQYFTNAQSLFENQLNAVSGSGLADVKTGLARAYGSIGIVFSEQSNYPRALEYDLKAVKICEESGELGKCARLYNNIGIVYQSEGEDFKALDYFIKSLNAQQKTGDKTTGFAMTNIGNVYLRQKNFAKAFDYYKKAELQFSKNPDARGLGELYNNLGLYFQDTNDFPQALTTFEKAISEFQKIDDRFGLADTYFYIGALQLRKANYSDALLNTQKSLDLATELQVLEQVRNAEQNLSLIYEKTNQPQLALQHFKAYNTAKDSIGNSENIRNSVRAEMNFEFEKKEALTKKELEKKEILYHEKSKRHQQQIFFIVLFILLLFGIVFLIYNRLQLKKTLTLQKELAEYEQKALHLQMNPHFVFNCLGSISSFIVQNGTDSAIKYLSKFSKLMRLTLEYSKESLIPIDREMESLQNYLELEQLRFNQKFEFSIHKSNEIEDDMALPPLLLQPFVENAIIHGLIPKKENGQIAVDFQIDNVTLVCTITDNGIGFHKSQELKENLVSVHKSMALDITRKRLEMMEAYTSKSANVTIEEIKNEQQESVGTKVTLRLPIQYSTK